MSTDSLTKADPESDKREAYLEAMASWLGCDMRVVSALITGLLLHKESFKDLPYIGKQDQLATKTAYSIEALGSAFLVGSGLEWLKFVVGSNVLAILGEKMDSAFFTYLRSYVGKWTDGEGEKAFDERLSK